MSALVHTLNALIEDPFDGPFEGEDFIITPQGDVEVTNADARLAAIIMRKVNTSGAFAQRLVKTGQRGDVIILGFDTLIDAAPVYTTKIGVDRKIIAEVKKTPEGKYCVYLNKERQARTFNKQVSAKTYLKTLNAQLLSVREQMTVEEAVEE